jgi:hypothetical protein
MLAARLKHIIFKIILAYTFLFSAVFSYAQTTKVSGKIVDAISREPLPFVNIIFKGTTVGVATDIEGKYTMSTTLKVDSLVVSYIGYTKVTRAVKAGTTQEMNIGLTQGIELAAIEVKPGENPAHRILRKIIANKDKNDREEYEAYEYEVYNKVEFDLNNLKRRLSKQ